MHDLSPIIKTLLTATGGFAAFMSVLLAWAAFIMDGAGKTEVAGAFLLIAAAVGVSAGFLLRTVWGGK